MAKVYNYKLIFVRSVYPMDQFILTFGVDKETRDLEVEEKEYYYLKFWKSDTFTSYRSPKPIKTIPIGKPNTSQGKFDDCCFDIAKNNKSFMIGCSDGSIHIYKNQKNSEIFNTEKGELQTKTLQQKNPITSVHIFSNPLTEKFNYYF